MNTATQTDSNLVAPLCHSLKKLRESRQQDEIFGGDLLVANSSFPNAFDGKRAFNIADGTIMTVTGFDTDGDVLVYYVRDIDGGKCEAIRTTIMNQDLCWCSKLKIQDR